MKDIVEQQRDFFKTHTTKEIPFRIAQLKLLERVIKENISLLDDAIYSDFKKSPFENYASEIGLILHDISEAKRKLYRWSRKTRVKTNLPNFPASSYIIPEPLGVALVIGTWNYPYLLSLAPVVAAIAAGNTVILKPSELPAVTAGALEEIINNNFDPAFLKVVTGGIPETTELLQQQFDKIFFTGSTAVGKIVYKAAAEHLTPVTLELGGKSPAFITANANLKMTAKRLIWAKFLNAGQTCIAPDYVLIAEDVQSKFLNYAKEEIVKARYAFENDNYVQIINERNFDRLTNMLDASKIYCGGDTDKSQRYIAPTILAHATFKDAAMQEEIFGPILPVISYTNLDEAIDQVMRLPKPLSCYVFTKSAATKKKILKQLSFGGGAINDAVMHIANSNLPFGGVGASGMGNYHGEAGFRTFSHYKSILDKPTWFELPIKFSPYSKGKMAILKRLLKL